MKLTTTCNDPDQFAFKLTPKGVPWMLLFGLALLCGGVGTVWALGCVTRIEVGSEGLAAEQLFLGRFAIERREAAATEIEAVNTKIYNYGISRSYEVNVVTSSDEFPIPVASLDGDQKAALAEQMQAALVGGSDLDYRSSTGLMWIGFALGAMCLVGGYYCLAFLQTSTITVDRPAKQIEVANRRWLLPFRRRAETVALNQVDGFEQRVFRLGSRHSQLPESYFLSIRTKDSRRVRLADGPMFTEESASEVQKLLKQWTG
ncbi:MAG: hypothetical protein AAGA92_09900 [Planctomycetota bacterium]